MSRLLSNRWITALGALGIVAVLLGAAVASPSVGIGQETDSTDLGGADDEGTGNDPDGDADADSAQPPASLPNTGGGMKGTGFNALPLAAGTLMFGLALAGGGYLWFRSREGPA
jgi:hypothetical protein